MRRKTWIVVLAVVLLLAIVGTTVAVIALRRPKPMDLKSTPFATHEGMLAVDVTVRRLASPSIDEIVKLDKGRISAGVPGDSQIKLLDAEREEVFVLEFEASYTTSGSTKRLDEALMTFVLPYSTEAVIVRVETPQGSAEQPIE